MEEKNIERQALSPIDNESQDLSKKNIVILNKIISWCFYIFVGLFPLWFLPFSSNVLNLNKQILMICLLTVALTAWMGKLLTQKRFKWFKGITAISFLIFVVIYGLATALSLRPYNSLMGFDAHLSRAFINLIYFFIFFVLFMNHQENSLKRKAEIIKLLIIFLASSMFVAIIGFLQLFKIFVFPWDFTKAASFNTVGTLTGLGIFLAVLFPLALSFLLSIKPQKDKKERRIITGFRIFLVLFLIFDLIMILLLGFKVLWIMTAIAMVILIGFWLSQHYRLFGRDSGRLVVPIVILAICLVFLLFKPTIFTNLNLPLEVGLSYKGGINIVKEIIGRNPILGTGPETFVYNYSLYKPQSINPTIFWNLRFSNAPAEILNLISETGILGVLAFLALIAIFLFKTVKNLTSSNTAEDQMSEIKIGLFSSWLALLAGWFLYPQNITLMFVFWLFFTFLVVLTIKKEDIMTVNLKTSSAVALLVSFGFIIITIAVIGLLYIGGSKYMAEVKYKSGIELVNKGKLEPGINNVVRATIINPYEDRFYKNLAQLFLLQLNQTLGDPNLETQEKISKAQVEISNAVNSAVRATILNPKDVANWIVRGSIYRNLINRIGGAGNWAINSYQEALSREPNNPFIYVEIARTYVNTADLISQQEQNQQTAKQIMDYLDQAVNAYNSAIILKPNYSLAHFEIALVYGRQGKTAEAITKMEALKQSNPKDIGIAFQLGVLYYKTSQFDKAKSEFTRAVSLDENFSNARYFLGLLYDEEGNKTAAIEQFEKIAGLNLDNDLVKQILVNLRAGKPALGSPELGPPEQPEEIPLEEKQPEQSKFKLP